VDSFVIRYGRIVMQTIRYSLIHTDGNSADPRKQRGSPA
jgi:hypothetical protein